MEERTENWHSRVGRDGASLLTEHGVSHCSHLVNMASESGYGCGLKVVLLSKINKKGRTGHCPVTSMGACAHKGHLASTQPV